MGDILKVHVRQIDRSDAKDFYRLMGPLLSRREVVAELGFPVWDDDDKQWFVAIVWENARSKVAGFCAYRAAGDHVALTSAYVRPEYRGRHVYDQLWSAREAALQRPCLVRAMVRPGAIGTFKRHKFKAARKTKQFTLMEKKYV